MARHKKYKFKFFNNRKEILNHDTSIWNFWRWIPRRHRLKDDDGWYLLMYDYFEGIREHLLDKHGLKVKDFYEYDHEDLLHFTVEIPITKRNCSDDYLNSIKWIGYHNHPYFLSSYIIKKNGKLRLLYMG